MFLSKNKFFVCVLLLSVTIYLMSAPIARADFVVDAVSGVFDAIVDNILIVALVIITVVVMVYFPPGGLALAEATTVLGTTAPVTGIGLVAAEGAAYGFVLSPIITTSTWSLVATTYLTYAGALAITGIVDVIALCAGTDIICPGGGDNTGGVLMAVDTTQYECDNPQRFEIKPTFYIPSFNQGYVTGPNLYCYYDLYEDQICEPIPADAQRYMPESFDDGENVTIDPCATPDPNGTMVMLSGNRCVPVTPGATTLQSIDETQNKIALYRVTAPVSQFEISPGEIDKNALVKWFTGISGDMGVSEHKFGDGLAWFAPGYETTQIIEGRPEEHLLAVKNYSDICSGNQCTIKDNLLVPENSYIFYAAKILGDYQWPVVTEYSCGDEDWCERTDYETSPAKFLSIQNPSIQRDLAMFPWIAKDRYSIGDVLWGPTQTGALEECPATQEPQQTLASIIVSTTGTGSGVITSTVGGVNIGGLNCGGGFTTCSNTYDIGAAVTLTATPGAGSSFSGWSGDCLGNSCSLTMNADKSVIATFAAQSKTLTVTKSGAGSGIVEDISGGIYCDPTCSNVYNTGMLVIMTATPAEGSTFTNWSGCDSVISDNRCKITMDADKTVNAEFSKPQSPPGPFNWNPSDDGITSTCNQVMLSWTASAGADRYEVRKQTKSGGGYGPWQVIATKTSDANSHTDYDVVQHNDYKYQVIAYNDAGEREIGARGETTPYCSPTVDLSVTPGSWSRIYQGGSTSLTWTSTYANSCAASASKPQSDWSGSMATSGTKGIHPSPPPFVDYTITCTGLGPGGASDTVKIDIDALGLPGWREIIPR